MTWDCIILLIFGEAKLGFKLWNGSGRNHSCLDFMLWALRLMGISTEYREAVVGLGKSGLYVDFTKTRITGNKDIEQRFFECLN